MGSGFRFGVYPSMAAKWQGKLDAGALPACAETYGSAVKLHGSPDRGQPDSNSTVFGCEKQIEHTVADGIRYAGPVVLDRQPGDPSVAAPTIRLARNVHATPLPAPKFWGDVVGSFNGTVWTPPQGSTNIDDAVATIEAWQEKPGAPHVSVTDVEPQELNLLVNFNDVLQIILAFKGLEYPFSDPLLCP